MDKTVDAVAYLILGLIISVVMILATQYVQAYSSLNITRTVQSIVN